MDFSPARPGEGHVEPLAFGGSRILAEAARYLGQGCRVTGFCGPWCKAFTNVVLRRLGYHPTPSLRARDALRDGRRVRRPAPGDLVYLRFSHVTFFVGYGGRGLIGLGGNQAGAVTVQSYPLRAVVAYVEPR